MESRMIIGGFGGQGVLMVGQLLGYAACLNDKHSLFLPHYGPEQRGGTARCNVTISDEPIHSPFVRKVDVLMTFNDPSLVKFLDQVKESGTLLLNSSNCEAEVSRKDIKIYPIPADEIAKKIGSSKVINIVMLGAYIGQSGILTKEEMISAIRVKLAKKPQLMDMNLDALVQGMLCVTGTKLV